MLFRPRLVRRRARAYRRPLVYVLAALFFLDAWCTVRSRVPTQRSEAAASEAESTGRNTSVFIVSVHRNTEPILRAAWTASVLALVDHLGRDRVYVSAVESGSQDDTKAALDELRAQLQARGVGHTITLGTTVWEQLDELAAQPAADAPADQRRGWVWDPDEQRLALRRIPYLARVRNEAMAPLQALADGTDSQRFDQILWINDVAFDVDDVLALLDTRGGRYAAACAVDFMRYPAYYDTFALRDAAGDKAVSSRWPWFWRAADRAAVRAGRPVRVQSCWNGMVAFAAAPFYGPAALRFRGVDDSLAAYHLEGSECCLVHADNPLSAVSDENDENGGVWINPNVRVAYSVPVYRQVRTALFPGAWAAVAGTWANRIGRLQGHFQFALEWRTVQRRLQQWQAKGDGPGGQPRHEPGAACLINEMQIMWQNGWKHL